MCWKTSAHWSLQPCNLCMSRIRGRDFLKLLERSHPVNAHHFRQARKENKIAPRYLFSQIA